MKLLIVDDSSTMRRIIRNALSCLEAEMEDATDGIEALTLLGNSPTGYDLVLLDWNMPNKNGFETLTAIKADPSLAAIPVVMVTTEAERAQVVKAIQAGACQYVTKPFQPEMLVEKVNKALGKA